MPFVAKINAELFNTQINNIIIIFVIKLKANTNYANHTTQLAKKILSFLP